MPEWNVTAIPLPFINILMDFSDNEINYPAASSGVLTTQSGKDLRGKPRGIQPEEI